MVQLRRQVVGLQVEGDELCARPPDGQRIEVGRVEARRARVGAAQLARRQLLELLTPFVLSDANTSGAPVTRSYV